MTSPSLDTPHFTDRLRQGANLILAPAMWVCSSLWLWMPQARSAQGFSNLSDNPLVPWGPAFSIWFPIFLGVIAYGVLQCRPHQATRDVFRQTGWLTAGGFALICGWGLGTAFLSEIVVELAATLIFIPGMVLLVIAMVRFTRLRRALTGLEIWLVATPIALIAGWCSIAVFIGMNPLIAKLLGIDVSVSSPIVLIAALVWIIVVLRRGALNRVYAFPPIWGLGFLAYRHFALPEAQPSLAWLALAGILALILAVTVKTHQTQPDEILS